MTGVVGFLGPLGDSGDLIAAAVFGLAVGALVYHAFALALGRPRAKELLLELANLLRTNEELQAEKADLAERVIQLSAQLKFRGSQVSALARQLDEARQEADAAAGQLTARRDEAQRLQVEVARRDRALVRLGTDLKARDAELTNSRRAAEEIEQKYVLLNDRYDRLSEESQVAEEELAATRHRLRHARRAARRLRKQVIGLSDQVEGVLKQDGRVWARPYAGPRPEFRPLTARKAPVISVLNLKGGVGKTTLTANLGAALARSGSRVLLADLDYQQSLSTLCLDRHERKLLHQQERCLQHFLLSPGRDAKTLLGCAEPLRWGEGAACSVVVNSNPKDGTDGLEDVEMRLLAEWLVRPGVPDIRLFLRQALHAPAITERFDYVLLDCPPRLTTAAVNALAASDYVLIPVLLDWTSAVAVPSLLQALRGLIRTGVLPELAVLGIVANRAAIVSERLIHREAVVWQQDLPNPCNAAWGGPPLHFCETLIRQSPGIAEAANAALGRAPGATIAALADSVVGANFSDLAAELQKEVPHACRRVATVSA